MPNRHTTLTSLFDDIADAIRAKTGDSAEIKADDFDTAIAAIPGGGPAPESDDYFYIKPLSLTADANAPYLRVFGYGSIANAVDLKYSYDKITWYDIELNTTNIMVTEGVPVYFKNNKNNLSVDNSSYIKILQGYGVSSNRYEVGGRLGSLCNNISNKFCPIYSFYRLFHTFDQLQYADKLELPEYIGYYSCNSMFYNCTNLQTPPKMGNIKLIANLGCGAMFQGCTSLTTVPILTSKFAYSGMYGSMFYGCSNLGIYTEPGEGHTIEWKIPYDGAVLIGSVNQSSIFSGIKTDSVAANLSLSKGAQSTFYVENEPIR